MTPDRSHRTPHSAPSVSGTARSNVLWSMPTRFTESPRAAQVSSAKMNRATAAPNTA